MFLFVHLCIVGEREGERDWSMTLFLFVHLCIVGERGRGRERLEYDFVCVRAFVYCGRERLEYDSLVITVACTEIYDVGGV